MAPEQHEKQTARIIRMLPRAAQILRERIAAGSGGERRWLCSKVVAGLDLPIAYRAGPASSEVISAGVCESESNVINALRFNKLRIPQSVFLWDKWPSAGGKGPLVCSAIND